MSFTEVRDAMMIRGKVLTQIVQILETRNEAEHYLWPKYRSSKQ